MRRNRTRVIIAREIYFYFPLLLLLVPIRLILALLLAVAVHEAFHIAAIRCLKIPVRSIYVGIRGMIIETPTMSPMQELLCSAAGPLGGTVLLLFLRWLPLVALVSAIQTLYNLLPIYPTDGGRVLRCITNLLLPENVAGTVINITENLTRIAIVAGGIFLIFWLHLGILPMLLVLSVLLGWQKRK